MMITLTVPMLSQIPVGDPLRKGLLLSVPFAANIGGMGTPIASPPNAVAVSFLLEAGYEISFLQWVLIATPLMAGLLLFAGAYCCTCIAPGRADHFCETGGRADEWSRLVRRGSTGDHHRAMAHRRLARPVQPPWWPCSPR